MAAGSSAATPGSGSTAAGTSQSPDRTFRRSPRAAFFWLALRADAKRVDGTHTCSSSGSSGEGSRSSCVWRTSAPWRAETRTSRARPRCSVRRTWARCSSRMPRLKPSRRPAQAGRFRSPRRVEASRYRPHAGGTASACSSSSRSGPIGEPIQDRRKLVGGGPGQPYQRQLTGTPGRRYGPPSGSTDGSAGSNSRPTLALGPGTAR